MTEESGMADDGRRLSPGDVIGILGGGQLGRMMALAAARLGLKCHIFCPDPQSPAFEVSAALAIADYRDEAALTRFAGAVDVVTYEFENVPAETAAFLAARRPLRPGAKALAIAQDRLAEKSFLAESGIPVAPFAAIDRPEDIAGAVRVTGLPAILKTRRFGYDGKGQALVTSEAEIAAALARFGQGTILEGVVPFALECSVIVARGLDGMVRTFDIAENVHRNHILKHTTVPAGIERRTADLAANTALAIADALAYIGVLSVELFVLRDEAGERLLVNEIAPRVHNSGHWTEDACLVSQFEQHIRAVAGWPLAEPIRLADVVMENLIGTEAEDWAAILADPQARLHLYGKSEIRPGRKMGHVNRLRLTGAVR